MTRITVIRPQFVEFVPDQLEAGVLYISRRYATAAHLCCCGCGSEVFTPLNPAKWRLAESNGRVSLSPSVGNWSQPCQSHYWIAGNQVKWAGTMPAEMIAAVKRRDRRDAERLTLPPPRWWTRLWQFIMALFCGKQD